MEKRVSRMKNRLAMVFLFAFLFHICIGCIGKNLVMMLLSCPFFIAGVVLMLAANRCPHCGTYFRGLYWYKLNAGYCVKCGKVIEFDDCDSDE